MRDVVEKANHCAWQINYYVVFPVKYRRLLLDDAVVKIIMMTAKDVENRYDIEFKQIGCDKDHVHRLILVIDAFLDMGRSATNAVGNFIAIAVVAKWEGELLSESNAAANERKLDAELSLTLDSSHKD